MFGNGIGSRGFMSNVAAEAVTLLWYCRTPECGKGALLFYERVPVQHTKAPQALPLKDHAAEARISAWQLFPTF